MTQLRKEIYDNNGLVEVVYIEIDTTSIEELIAQKEAQLLEMFKELQNLQKNI